MKKVMVLFLVSLLIVLVGCSDQKEAQEVKSEAEVPKVDLHSAVVTDDLAVIRQHIETGSDLNVLEPTRSSTPLITAAAVGKIDAAKLLIDAGADLDYQNADGSTALITAAVFNRVDFTTLLLDKGADPNIINKDGSSALHSAAFLCRPDVVKVLLEKGADKSLKNKTGQTAREVLLPPFEEVKSIYDAVGAALRPLGIVFDYEYIKVTRPEIAEMLK